jgi:polysaccharide pyruvyl transferase WcaK-like protein
MRFPNNTHLRDCTAETVSSDGDGNRRRRIALFGQFGTGNLGNDGSLTAMLRFLRRSLPDAQILCICSGPKQVTEEHHIGAIDIHTTPTRHWRYSSNTLHRLTSMVLLCVPAEVISFYRMWAFLRRVDAIVFPGTGILDDFGLRPFGLPYNMFKWTLIAKLCGAKLHFISVGAGPVHGRLSRWFFRAVVLLADHRSYRDQISRDYITSIV